MFVAKVTIARMELFQPLSFHALLVPLPGHIRFNQPTNARHALLDLLVAGVQGSQFRPLCSVPLVSIAQQGLLPPTFTLVHLVHIRRSQTLLLRPSALRALKGSTVLEGSRLSQMAAMLAITAR